MPAFFGRLVSSLLQSAGIARANQAAQQAAQYALELSSGIVSYLNQVYVAQYRSFGRFLTSLEAWAAAVNQGMKETATGFRIVNLQAIPRGARWALSKAVKQAETYTNRTVHDQVLTEQKRRIANDDSLLRRSLSLATLIARTERSLAGALSWIVRYGALVTRLLTSADRLASWLGLAMLRWILTYLLTSGASLIAWFVRQIIGDLPAFAHLLEDVLGDLF